MKSFQVLSAGTPIFYFAVEPEYADDEPSERNEEIVQHLVEILDVAKHGPNFVPQLISRLPIVISDRDPDHEQPELQAWVSPKLRS